MPAYARPAAAGWYSPDTYLLPSGGGRDKNGVELGSLEARWGCLECFGRALPLRTEPRYFARRGRSAACARHLPRRCMYSVSMPALPARCVLPIRMLLRPRTLRYRLLSRKRSLAALPSQCLSAGTKHVPARPCYRPVFLTLLSRRDSASGQRLQLVGGTCTRLDLCITKTCRWSPLWQIPTLTRIHTLVGSHCEPSEKCTPGSCTPAVLIKS